PRRPSHSWQATCWRVGHSSVHFGRWSGRRRHRGTRPPSPVLHRAGIAALGAASRRRAPACGNAAAALGSDASDRAAGKSSRVTRLTGGWVEIAMAHAWLVAHDGAQMTALLPRLRMISLTEATSYLLLLAVAMPLKHFGGIA